MEKNVASMGNCTYVQYKEIHLNKNRDGYKSEKNYASIALFIEWRIVCLHCLIFKFQFEDNTQNNISFELTTYERTIPRSEYKKQSCILLLLQNRL